MDFSLALTTEQMTFSAGAGILTGTILEYILFFVYINGFRRTAEPINVGFAPHVLNLLIFTSGSYMALSPINYYIQPLTRQQLVESVILYMCTYALSTKIMMKLNNKFLLKCLINKNE